MLRRTRKYRPPALTLGLRHRTAGPGAAPAPCWLSVASARGEPSLRQQQCPAEAERVASKFPYGLQDVPGAQHAGRNRTHVMRGRTYSEIKEIAQKYPDRVNGEHTSLPKPSSHSSKPVSRVRVPPSPARCRLAERGSSLVELLATVRPAVVEERQLLISQ